MADKPERLYLIVTLSRSLSRKLIKYIESAQASYALGLRLTVAVS